MVLFFLTLGLLGLWFGSQMAVRGARSISGHFRVSSAFVGLFVLAIGTDLPELMVTVSSALRTASGADASGIIFGNVVGSILSQGTLLLGISVCFGILALSRRRVLRDGLMMVASIGLLYALSLDGSLSAPEGMVLIGAYALYAILALRQEGTPAIPERVDASGFLRPAALLVAGLAVLGFSSSLVVENALTLAASFHVSQVLVSILAIGLGTSLPELVTSVTAMRRGEGALAFGNLVGSCTVDALLVPGIGAVIAFGLNVDPALLRYDFPALLVSISLIVVTLMLFRRIDYRYAFVAIGIYFLYFEGMAIFGM